MKEKVGLISSIVATVILQIWWIWFRGTNLPMIVDILFVGLVVINIVSIFLIGSYKFMFKVGDKIGKVIFFWLPPWISSFVGWCAGANLVLVGGVFYAGIANVIYYFFGKKWMV